MSRKTLKDLSKEEIGRLFPIKISTYDENWPRLFEQEKALITATVEPALFNRIEHFGSTSVPGLASKDTIDILMEVDFNEENNSRLIEQLHTIGYDFNWQNEGGHQHMVFVKGYDPNMPKQQTYHIHAGPKTHPLWDRILFRDYLIAHPETAKAYADLKKELAMAYKHERVAYRVAKTAFVKQVTDQAKQKQ